MPQSLVDHAHAARAGRPATAGLVRCDQNFRPLQRHHSGILKQIVVVANEDRRAVAAGQVKHGKLAPTRDVFVDKGVKLAVAHVTPVRHRDNVTVEQIALVAPHQKTGTDTDVEFPRQPQQLQRGRPVGDRLGKYVQFRPRQVAQKPIPGHAHLRADHQLRALPRRLGGKPPHLGQVGLLVTGPMLELNRGNFCVLHRNYPSSSSAEGNGLMP